MSAGIPPAMVLAAGFGTRLRPLTGERPKPLCMLGDRPQIDHAIELLARAGAPRVVVNVHHLADAFDDAWRASQPVEIAIVREPHILGTAGGIANAGALLGDDDVVIWNADMLADVDVQALVSAHRESGASATLVVAPSAGGRVGVSAAGRVTRLRDARFGEEASSADYLGIAVLGAAMRARLPAEGCLVGDVLIPVLGEGAVVQARSYEGSYRDTGSLEDYLEANLAWLGDRASWIGAGATVAEGVELRGAIVGAGARVEGSGALEACVVWPGATARAPLARAIVTSRAVVPVSPRA